MVVVCYPDLVVFVLSGLSVPFSFCDAFQCSFFDYAFLFET